MVYSNKPSPSHFVLDHIQSNISNYDNVFDADTNGLTFIIGRPLPSEEISVPAIYCYQDGTDLELKGMPNRKHKIGTYTVNIEWHTTKQDTWQEEQLINDIIVRDNKAQSTHQLDDSYTDGIDSMILNGFKHGVITDREGTFSITYLLGKVTVQYQDSYR